MRAGDSARKEKTMKSVDEYVYVDREFTMQRRVAIAQNLEASGHWLVKDPEADRHGFDKWLKVRHNGSDVLVVEIDSDDGLIEDYRPFADKTYTNAYGTLYYYLSMDDLEELFYDCLPSSVWEAFWHYWVQLRAVRYTELCARLEETNNHQWITSAGHVVRKIDDVVLETDRRDGES